MLFSELIADDNVGRPFTLWSDNEDTGGILLISVLTNLAGKPCSPGGASICVLSDDLFIVAACGGATVRIDGRYGFVTVKEGMGRGWIWVGGNIHGDTEAGTGGTFM
jgi:hypothetical protein